MKKIIIALCVLVCFLFCGCSLKNWPADNSSDNSSYQNNITKVSFDEVKDDLVGGYHYADAAVYSYNYIFFENGDYIIIDLSNNRFTEDNSTVSYFERQGEYNEEIVIKLDRTDGKQLELYGTKHWLTYEGDPLGAVKTPDIVHYGTTGNDPSRLADFRFEDFKDIECGKSNYVDIGQVLLTVLKAQVKDLPNTTLGLRVYVSPIGDVTDFPTADGKYIRITYDEGLIVKSIEVVDELCEVYF